jgi:hypothetical protein
MPGKAQEILLINYEEEVKKCRTQEDLLGETNS